MKKSNKQFDFRTITSFEKACEKTNTPEVIPDVSTFPERFRKPIVAVYKLFVIFEAINDGWTAEMGDGSQIKYYPGLPVLSSGCGFDHSHYDFAITFTAVGSRLCTDTAEKAIFIGEQFGVLGQEYKDFFLNKT